MKRLLTLNLTLAITVAIGLVGRADEVRIRVLNENGVPAAGAKVWIVTGRQHEPAAVYATDATGILSTILTPFPEYRQFLGRATALAPGWAAGGILLKPGENEIRLAKARAVSGRVLDTDGKPVEGAIVRPISITGTRGDYSRAPWIGETPEWSDFLAKTDATGKWTLPFTPQMGQLAYELFDARYARVQAVQSLASDAKDAKPLTARPGAFIEGRVLGTDGKPATGLWVSAIAQGGQVGTGARTDENGRYSIDKLGPGSYTLTLYRTSKDRPAATVDAPVVTEGKTVQAPDIAQVEGVPVEGTVTDEVTGAPLAGATIGVSSNLSYSSPVSAMTGADGRFSIQTLPGKNQIYLAGLPTGYRYPAEGAPSRMLQQVVPAEGLRNLAFKLPVALTLTGRVVDEAGAPVNDAKIQGWQNWTSVDAEMGKDGSFSFKSLDTGPLSLNVDGDWAMVDAPKITLPQKEPVVVKVRHLTLKPLGGRIVDTTGQPVADAEVQVSILIRVSESNSMSRMEILASGANGRYELPKARPDYTYTVAAKKPGYRFVSGGKIASNKEIMAVSGTMIPNPNPSFSIEDIVLEKLSQSLSGVVKAEDGTSVAGAEIYAAGSENIARTDNEGRFQIGMLPPGNIEIFAAKGQLFAWARSKGGAVEELVLKPVETTPPAGAGRALLKEILASEQSSYYADSALTALAVNDPDEALKLVSTIKEDRQARAGTLVLLALAKGNPQKARERIADLLGALPKRVAGYEAVQLANEIAVYEPDEARAIYDREKAKLKSLPADGGVNNQQGARLRLGLGALASQLRIEGADALLDEGLAAGIASVAAVNADNGNYYLDGLLEAAAPGGAPVVERIASKIPPERRAAAMARALPTLARRDLKGAMHVLDIIPNMPEPKTSRTADSQPEYAFGSGAMVVIAQLGRTDPAAALALARHVTSDYHKANALALAATFQPKETAIPLLREAFAMKLKYSGDEFRLPVARYAAMVDTKLGEELLLELENRTLGAETSDDRFAGRQIVSQLAFALGPVVPGHARLLLEREANRTARKEVWTRVPALLAMARVDFGRAEEMARNVAGNGNDDENHWMQSYSLSLLAQYAVMSEADRKNASLNRLQRGILQWNEGEE